MCKAIGIEETILDIILHNEQLSVAIPGGSVFNGIVLLNRTGVPVCFISETGNDHVGGTIPRFTHDNHISTEYADVLPDGESPVSLAFLSDNSDAEYIFYKDYPKQRLDIIHLELKKGDVVVIGSYHALNPVLREKVLRLLDRARKKEAIIYYNPNFRSSHKEEVIKLTPIITENLEYVDIARGSQEDLFHMYNLRDADKIYRDKIKFYCPDFLCTTRAEKITLRTGSVSKEYDILPLEAVSTIGAGDNSNAGTIYGLLKYDIRYDDLNGISEARWDEIICYDMESAAEVCKSYSNSVSNKFAERYRY